MIITIEVEVTRVEGKFISKDALAEALVDEVDTLGELCVDDSIYVVESATHVESTPAPKAKRTPKGKLVDDGVADPSAERTSERVMRELHESGKLDRQHGAAALRYVLLVLALLLLVPVGCAEVHAQRTHASEQRQHRTFCAAAADADVDMDVCK